MTGRGSIKGIGLLGLLLGGLLQAAWAQDGETVCAVVKIEIRQELTLERQAFDAHMRITNGLETLTLEDINVNVTFRDEDGNAVLATSDPDDTSASFFIRIDRMDGISDVSGGGQILPTEVADIHWLIIPAPGAGGSTPSGELYAVGATLSYTFGGESETVNVSPDFIQVKPMPILELDYFLPSKVYADDPLTPEVESVVPFPLGLRISNTGAGDAHKLQIESAQPEIIDNDQGLLISFEILGTSVNDSPVEETLLADFGTLPAGESSVARWIMTSSLSGEFIDFSADFIHSDELGGELTSLIDSVNTHLIVSDVLLDAPGRDTVTDFLSKEGTSYRVFESDGVSGPVADASGSVSFTSTSAKSDEEVTERSYSLTFSAPEGPVFARWPDPTGGEVSDISAFRSDGKLLDSRNIWVFPEDDGSGGREYFFGLFDSDSTGSYEIRIASTAPENQPPSLSVPSDLEIEVGQTGQFTANASDPDGTNPTITASGLPSGASFSDSGDGTATFEWAPGYGDLGEHTMTVTASDGELTDTVSVAINVIPPADGDADDDGMDDEWEQEHFGDLSRDGTGDFDLDSATDLQEHDFGGDPTLEDRPTAPSVLSPDGTSVGTDTPELRIRNSSAAAEASVSYEFQLYRAGDLRAPLINVQVAETPLETAWQVDPGILNENEHYEWRVRAFDGITPSPWRYGQFQLDAIDDPPSLCLVSHPADAGVVGVPRPELAVLGGNDPDGSPTMHRFRVFSDAGLSEMVADSGWLSADDGLIRRWTPYAYLDDGQTYFWLASISDSSGTVADCAVKSFTVDTLRSAPTGYLATETVAPDGLTLRVEDIEYAGGDSLEAAFEISTDPVFQEDTQISGTVPVSESWAEWAATGLEEDRTYYWRVRVLNGGASGNWIYRQVVFSADDAIPGSPIIRNYGDATWVDTLSPTLALSRGPIAEEDLAHFEFEVFTSAQADTPVQSGTRQTGKFTAQPLLDRQYYYWRAYAVDESGQRSQASPLTPFFTIDDQVDAAPEFGFVDLDSPRIERRSGIDIRWTDHDPDSAASIALYWDTDQQGRDGVLIAEGIAEDDPADRYRWDASNVEPSKVYLYAVVTDGTSETVVYSPAAIFLESADILAFVLDDETNEDGGQGRVAVALGAKPRDYVIVRAAVSDSSEAGVSPRELLFSRDNWDQAQQLVITGKDDDLADGDIAFTLELAGESADEAYGGQLVNVGMANLDNDTAGFVVESDDPVMVTEFGDSGVVRVRLRTQPSASVELSAAVSDTGEATLQPDTVTFTPDNWERLQDFVITGLDDDDIDGDAEFELGFAPAISADADYEGLTPDPVPVVNVDDDAPFIFVYPTEGLTTTEGGGTAEFDVVLNAAPTAEVVVAVTSADESEGSVAPAELRFDAANWHQPQVVTVTGQADEVDDGNQAYQVIVHPASSADANYDGMDPADVELVNRQDGTWRMEARTVPLSGPGTDFFHVPFDQAYGMRPVVMARLEGAPDGRIVRIRNVTTTGFEAVVINTSGDDAGLEGLNLRYLAVTPGVHDLPSGGVLEAGRTTTDSAVGASASSWQQVGLRGSFDRPLVLAGLQSFNTAVGTPASDSVTWFGAAVGERESAQIQLASEAALLDPSTVALGPEAIGYVVLEQGSEGVLQWPGGTVRFSSRLSNRPAISVCTPETIQEDGLSAAVILAQPVDRGTDGGWLVECERGGGYVGYRYLSGDSESVASYARVLFESDFTASIAPPSPGLVVDKVFDLRVFEGERPGLLGISLANAPTAPVNVSLESSVLSVEPAELAFDGGKWQTPQWVDYAFADDGQAGVPAGDTLTLTATSGDPNYGSLAPVSMPVSIQASAEQQVFVDNDTAAFSTTGTWPVGTGAIGIFGDDYQYHAPNGPSPEFTLADNAGPEFVTLGEWPSSTEDSGYWGEDYVTHEPNGLKPGSVVLDDDQATFTHEWPEHTNREGYIGDHYHFHAPSEIPAEASWDLSDIDDDQYLVYANWTAYDTHASNAPYEIVDDGGETHVVRVDQRDNGGAWQLLGSFALDAESTVRLTNDADGHIIADAILLVPEDAPPNTAIWTIEVPRATQYHVFGRWVAGDDRATNATYTLHHRNGSQTFVVDQQQHGGQWNLLGTVPVDDELQVELTDVADGTVVADAIKLERVDAPPNEATWQLNASAVGDYEIFARWPAHPDRASNAHFSLDSGLDVEESLVDQTVSPGRWHYFGTHPMVPGESGRMVLNDVADGFVIADAVRVLDKRSAGARGVLVFDDLLGQSTGEWQELDTEAGYHDAGYRVHAAGSGEAAYEWPLEPYRHGPHRVYVRWTAAVDRATDAPYTISHADGETTVRVNQQSGGGEWYLLGEFELDGASRVRLTNDTDGDVVADAVRIVPAEYPER